MKKLGWQQKRILKFNEGALADTFNLSACFKVTPHAPGIDFEMLCQHAVEVAKGMADRHLILGAAFDSEGMTAQYMSSPRLDFEAIQISDEEALRGAFDQKSRQCFAIQEGHTWSLTFAKADDGIVYIIFVAHHVISDAMSVILMMSELMDGIAVRFAGASPSLPATAQYFETVADAPIRVEDEHYWADVLENISPKESSIKRMPNGVSSAFAQSLAVRPRGEALMHTLGYCQAHNIKISRYILACFAKALHIHYQIEAPYFEIPIVNRNRGNFNSIGFYASSLLVRVEPSKHAKFSEFVRHCDEQYENAKRHLKYPDYRLWADALDRMATPQQRSVPLHLNIQFQDDQTRDMGIATWEYIDLTNGGLTGKDGLVTHHDLALQIRLPSSAERGDCSQFAFVYDKNCIDAEGVQGLSEVFSSLLLHPGE